MNPHTDKIFMKGLGPANSENVGLLEHARRSSDSHCSVLHHKNDASPSALSPRQQVIRIVVECGPVLILSTISLLFTGELLEKISESRALRQIDQLVILVPVLLNLKGNLEVNLSSRMGTISHLGHLDDKRTRNGILFGNLCLLQFQTAIVSFVAACVAFLLGALLPSEMRSKGTRDSMGQFSDMERFVMVASSATVAALISSALMGTFICALVLFCRKFQLDPDNFAPPIASTLGDLMIVAFMGLAANSMFRFIHTPTPVALCIAVLVTTVGCFICAFRNTHVNRLLTQGWVPLFTAMIISCGAGIILDLFNDKFACFPLLALLNSGLPGSIGAVLIARLSTALHSVASHGTLKAPHQRAFLIALTLFLLSVPVALGSAGILHSIGWLSLPLPFIPSYLIFFCLTALLSLIVASTLTFFLWTKKLDPDFYALPIHSALVDFMGQLLLVACFEVVSALGMSVQL